MMIKRILLIDNEDLSETISEIEDLGKNQNIAIECYPLYIGLPDGNDVINSQGKIDVSLVRDKFLVQYSNLRFHMVASDFQLNDETIDGVKILNQFKSFPNTRKAKRILYSSELTEIIQGYLEDYKEGNKDFEASWKNFKALIQLDILDFLQRDEMEKPIVDNIRRVIENDEDFLIDELLGNGSLSFNSSIEIYEGLNFSEIAEKISSNDSQSLNFKKRLINLAVAHSAYLKDGE